MDIIRAAILNVVQLQGNAISTVVAKQCASRYPNMNKISNMCTNHIETIQNLDILMKGGNTDANPINTLLKSMVDAQQQQNPEPEWVKKLQESNSKLHGTVKSLHHRIDALESPPPAV
jgi:hypothetical protein